MKLSILATSALSIICAIMTGHTSPTDIDRLWKDFETAARNDQPRKQLEILGRIKEEALAADRIFDYYKAGENCVSVRARINWKDREAARAEFGEEIDKAGYPILTYFYKSHFLGQRELSGYVTDNRKTLENNSHPDFYKADRYISRLKYSKAISPADDYEYVLWSLLGVLGPKQEIIGLLREKCGNDYPKSAFIEYSSLGNNWTDDDASSFQQKYKGRAAAMLIEEDIILRDYEKLTENKAGSDAYRSIRKRCEEFENRRKSLSGKEKQITDGCLQAKSLIKDLDAKDISFSISRGVLEAQLVNLEGITIDVLQDNKTILSHQLSNPACSYHVPDTLTWTIPDLNDGEYTVKCHNGKVLSEQGYERRSISLAGKTDAEGYAVYAADYISGKPLDKADIVIVSPKGNTQEIIRDQDFSQGFVRIPSSAITTKAEEIWKYGVYCRFTDSQGMERSSERVSFHNYNATDKENITEAVIIKDRAAFRPGETVQFKAVAYHNGPEAGTMASGTMLQAVLLDPERNEISSLNLVTNDFGSVAGSFELDGRRNGHYSIEIRQDDAVLATTWLRVDEFILPNFELEFNQDDRIYLPGDEITLSGRIKSYSGHSLSSSVINCSITADGKTTTQRIKPDAEGNFSLKYKSDPDKGYQFINFNVAVTDVTGETLDWDKYVRISGSIYLDIEAIGQSDGSCSEAETIFSGEKAEFLIHVSSGSGRDIHSEDINVKWSLKRDGKCLGEGQAKAGDKLSLDMNDRESGLYNLETEAIISSIEGKEYKDTDNLAFLLVRDNDSTLDEGIDHIFKIIEEDGIAVKFGSGPEPVWMMLEIYGSNNTVLLSRLITMDGKNLPFYTTIRHEYEEEWPDQVLLNAFYFRDGNLTEFSHTFERKQHIDTLPLKFTRFEDKTLPGQNYSFLIKSESGVECAAAIFDKSSETIAGNSWSHVSISEQSAPYMYYDTECGHNGTIYGRMFKAGGFKASNAAIPVLEDAIMLDSIAVAEESESEASGSIIPLREDFAATIAFEPFLCADEHGIMEFNFTNKDKLSTFVISLFAHDRSMRNNVVRREMTVSIPVKIAVVEPQEFKAGDIWQLRASLSNNSEESISGTFLVESRAGSVSQKVCIPAEGEIMCSHEMRFAEIGMTDIIVRFEPEDAHQAGDAIKIQVPVVKASQSIQESHSALLTDAESREYLIQDLRSQFVNFDGNKAQITERTILDIVREAIPSKISCDSENAISLSQALYARILCGELGTPIDTAAMDKDLERLRDCICSDGGFAWFEGMGSSPIVTACVIYRLFSAMRACAHIEDMIAPAIKYLDEQQFNNSTRPYWRGALSPELYMYVRSLVPEVEFNAGKFDSNSLSRFRKEAAAFLTPSGNRGLNGAILSKARRLTILVNLRGSDEGTSLAKAWGISASKLRKSADKDLESLCQYAVEHKSGGIYFPNAVMPFRGLMESEAHAHALLCELMERHGRADIAEGIRMWLLVQKECQKWDDDPGYIEALASIMHASDETLSISVISLNCNEEIPYEEIKASGNGMTVSCSYYRVADGQRHTLSQGDSMKLGERILAEYYIQNDENRSFGRITAGRPACLRPVDQLSGYQWGYYRIVHGSSSEFLMDVLPEDKLIYTEEFFVTQTGTFQSAAVTAEAIYAPHYRANTNGDNTFLSSAAD